MTGKDHHQTPDDILEMTSVFRADFLHEPDTAITASQGPLQRRRASTRWSPVNRPALRSLRNSRVRGRCHPPGSVVLGSARGLNRRHVLDREVWRDSESRGVIIAPKVLCPSILSRYLT